MPFIRGEYEALKGRGISLETCKKYSYQVGEVPEDHPLKAWRGQTVHIENFYEDRELVGQKLRGKDKNFAVIGDVKNRLWGINSAPAGSKLIVITEGAFDCMSYAEVRKTWPCLSIPNGTQSAKGTIKANIEYLETFDKVVLCFDNDKAGQDATDDCKGLLSPGKMFISKLSPEYKDLNEALVAGDVKSIMNAVLAAESVRPDGLVDVDDILEDALKPVEWGLPWFLDELTKLTYGRRYGETYGLGAGTGIGKTDVFTEQIAFDVNTLNLNVGVLFLEQKPTETIKRLAGKIGNRRFHVPDGGWTKEELIAACQPLRGKVTFYDSFGETDWSQVKLRIRHMALSKGIKLFYLDHLTAMADTSDERGSIEQIMKEMAGLANELGLIIHFISHLSTPDGTSHEEGGRVMIKHFKGSRSIGFWCFLMLGLERSQQSDDEDLRHTTTLRVLKDRYTGQATGHVLTLGYDAETGRIYPKEGLDPTVAGRKKAMEGF
jgi:twinkle protein